VAKTSLYRHFHSKDELIVAVLERHEELWTHGLLEAESGKRATTADERLAALIEILNEWLRDDGYGGCLFINSLLETHMSSPAIRAASVGAIERVYELLLTLAEETGSNEPRSLAHQLQVLFRGSIVAAVEGNFVAVGEARALALRLLEQGHTVSANHETLDGSN
jgi:AcrR family transcriptional regulator